MAARKEERIVVLLEAEQKAEVERRAAAMGISSGEFVRRAVAAYTGEEETAELGRVFALIDEQQGQIADKLGRVAVDLHTTLKKLRASREAREADHRKAQEEAKRRREAQLVGH